MLKDEIE